MKNLDLRTMLVALAIFSLGFAACFVVFGAPAVTAEVGDPVIIDRLVVTGYIEFLDGPQFVGRNGAIMTNGQLEAIEDLVAGDQLKSLNGLMVNGTTVIDSSRNLRYVTIDPSVTGGSGLDVGKLGGHSIEDFVLKDTSPQCPEPKLEKALPPPKQ